MSSYTVVEGQVVSPSQGPRSRALFGREPSAWVGLIEAVIALVILFPAANQWGLTQEWGTIVLAVVSAAAGVYTAWSTRDTMLGAILGLFKAGVVLFAFYGLEMSTEQQGTAVALVAVLVGFFQRTQTSPVDAPVSPSPTQVTESPVGAESTIPGVTGEQLDDTPADEWIDPLYAESVE